jgi:hypothetical protein
MCVKEHVHESVSERARNKQQCPMKMMLAATEVSELDRSESRFDVSKWKEKHEQDGQRKE